MGFFKKLLLCAVCSGRGAAGVARMPVTLDTSLEAV